jgi:hypothetical protein
MDDFITKLSFCYKPFCLYCGNEKQNNSGRVRASKSSDIVLLEGAVNMGG